MNKALFLDRDGVINKEKNYLYKIEDFEFIDGVFETCRYFQAKGYLIVIVTNQAGIARGMYTEEDFQKLTMWMLDEFEKQQISIAKVYHCPHHPDFTGACECRKPNPGMILQAQNEFDIDLENSILVGDKYSDVESGTVAGIKNNFLILTGHEIKACRNSTPLISNLIELSSRLVKMTRNIILHVHIFKNAGTSFDSALRTNFGEDFIDHRDDEALVQGKQEYLENFLREHPDVKAFSSHSIHFKPISNDEFNFIPVYFLRHPIDRIRSVYSFEKKQEPAVSIGSQKAKELSFNDYVAWRMDSGSPATIRNCQTIFLSGDGPNPNNIVEKYIKASSLVSNNNCLIGVVDNFDCSMMLFEKQLNEFFPELSLAYVRKNVTDVEVDLELDVKVEQVLAQLDNHLRQVVLDSNKYDSLLYHEVCMRMKKDITDFENFEVEMEGFLNRCRILCSKLD